MGKNIGIIGSGYVGLVTGTCFAKLGHQVICVDNDKNKIALLKEGKTPIYEPGLDEILKEIHRPSKTVRKFAGKHDKGSLQFTTKIEDAIAASEAIFICVGTPPREDGSADLSTVEHVAAAIARNLRRYMLIVEKSTVPVNTGKRIADVVRLENKKNVPFDVASNPEFLREGTAIHDFFHPDRIVFGVNSPRAEKLLRELYGGIEAQILVTDINSAELIKHASNSFLAMKIAYANALSRICDLVGADVLKVTQGLGLDKRIGPHFLQAGAGVGGFCLPKDLDAFYYITKRCGFDFKLLKEVKEINESQKDVVIHKLEEEIWNLKGKKVAVLGLSFKPDTDDLRFAPSLDLIKKLQTLGARVCAYDPVSMPKAKVHLNGSSVVFAENPYECLKNAHGAILVTQWDEFARLDFKRVKKTMAVPVLIDGRNFWDAEKLKALGFRYRGIGKN